MRNNPLLASFFVWGKELLGTDEALHVVVRHSDEFLDQCLLDYGNVKTVDDLKKIAFKYPYPDHSMFSGPLYRALIVEVEEAQSAGFVFNSE